MSIVTRTVEREIRHSVCPLDCPDTCSLAVEVFDGKVVKVKGSKANPFTAGVICSKVARRYPEFVHGPNRLRSPLKRTGKKGVGEFTPISWEEALDTIYQRFSSIIANYGAEAIAPFNYSGPHGMLAGGSMDMRFFNKLGVSKLNKGPLCAGVWAAAWESLYGSVPGIPAEEIECSKLVVVWGNNTAVSNLHFHRVLKRLRDNGGQVIVVDPRRTKIASQADLHIALKPGTDVVLAMAVATLLEKNNGIDHGFVEKHILGYNEYMEQARQYDLQTAAEICGVACDEIERMAEMYQRLSPAALSVGIGPERNRNGGAGIIAALALPALAGKFGVKGGGIIGNSGGLYPKTKSRLHANHLGSESTRVVNILDVPELTNASEHENPLRALFIYNHNPVAVHPKQNRMIKALENEDLFVVGLDVELNDSMKYADIVLPACTHFEHDDIFPAYGQQYLQKANAVIEPVGAALPNTQVFRLLAERFGFNDPEFVVSDAQLMDEAMDSDSPKMQGRSGSSLISGESLNMLDGDGYKVLFNGLMPGTPSGKVELRSEHLLVKFGQALPVFQELESEYPLTLLSPSSSKRTNATFGGSETSTLEVLDIHPDDAHSRSLSEGQNVELYNALGNVQLMVHITDEVRPGVVSAAKGAWLKDSPTGQTINALISGVKSDIGNGACYNDARIEVRAIT